MTYKDTNPTYNVNRKIVNFKDFNKDSEESELSKIKRSYKKNELEIGQSERKYKYNKITHKLDDMDKSEVEDKIDSLKESLEFGNYQGLEKLISFFKECNIEWYDEEYEDRLIIGVENQPFYFQWNSEGDFEEMVSTL